MDSDTPDGRNTSTSLRGKQKLVYEHAVLESDGGVFCTSWAGFRSRLTTKQAYTALSALHAKGLVERAGVNQAYWIASPSKGGEA